jgi:hypothetical protein
MIRLPRSARVVALVVSLPIAAQAGEAGTAGFLSLRLGAGARSAAMGDAYVSLAEDATAAYWNPAGLAATTSTQFTLMHLEWISSARMETASIAHATGFGTLGLHFSGMYFDELERRETASPDPTGHFNAYEISVAGAYGRKLWRDDIEAGGALKLLHSGLDQETATGWAADVGVRFHTRVPGLTFAGVAQNLGPKMKFVAEEFVLPATGRVGADYQREVPALRGALTGALDLVFPTDGDARQHVGFEYAYRNVAAARVGYKANMDSQGLTFGLGLRKGGYSFDYAYSDIDNDLGTGHKFAFNIAL